MRLKVLAIVALIASAALGMGWAQPAWRFVPRRGAPVVRRWPMGLGLLRLPLGTTATLRFYDGDPESEGALLGTLSFTAGEDSEVVFAQALRDAAAEAAFVTVALPERNETVALAERGILAQLGRAWHREGTVTVSLYDADPQAGGSEIARHSFTYGQDSAQGFIAALSAAAQAATHATISWSASEYTLALGARRWLYPGRR